MKNRVTIEQMVAWYIYTSSFIMILNKIIGPINTAKYVLWKVRKKHKEYNLQCDYFDCKQMVITTKMLENISKSLRVDEKKTVLDMQIDALLDDFKNKKNEN